VEGIEENVIVLCPPEPTITVAIDSNDPKGALVVIELLADEADEVPFALPAVTVNVYAVLAVKPVTVIGDDPVPVIDPGDDVAVKVEAVAPNTAAVYSTVAATSDVAVAVPIVGVFGIAADANPVLNLTALFTLLLDVRLIAIFYTRSAQ
jgi:hypothetical protein